MLICEYQIIWFPVFISNTNHLQADLCDPQMGPKIVLAL